MIHNGPNNRTRLIALGAQSALIRIMIEMRNVKSSMIKVNNGSFNSVGNTIFLNKLQIIERIVQNVMIPPRNDIINSFNALRSTS